MLTQNLLQEQAQNRRAQRAPRALYDVLQRINKDDYENLIEWIFENSQSLGLSCTTKFLARTFFDCSIVEPQAIVYDQYIALALAALALAIKFNESRQLSEQLTLQALLKSVDIYVPKSDYIFLEAKVMRSLSFVFKYTSPNDYLHVFMERFPFFPKFRKAIPKTIELALMRPYACQFKAEELFFGSVISIIELQRLELSQYQTRLLTSLTDCWENARKVANMIAEAILIAQTEQVDC